MFRFFFQLLSQVMSTLSPVRRSRSPTAVAAGQQQLRGGNVMMDDSGPASVLDSSSCGNIIKGQTKQSKRLPYWLWIIIAKCLGIKLRPNEKPVLSSILHILTMGTGAGWLLHIFSSDFDNLT